MNDEFKKRIKGFIWGMSGFTLVAVCTYLMNIADIREIDFWKLGTILVTVSAGYVVNGITKHLNTSK
jgi:hypothetical protein